MVKKVGQKRIRFQGQEYMLLEASDGSASIAPLDHFDENDRLTMYAGLFQVSYAHVRPNGEVWRYGEIIGFKKEIEEC